METSEIEVEYLNNPQMTISFEKPPIYKEANELFKLEELNMGTIFTYGKTLYNPSAVHLTEDLLEHELTHAKQHQFDDTVAGLWWKRFLADPQFRVDQEVEAYAAQYKNICKTVKDGNARNRRLHGLASALSSPMYGSVISLSEAMLRIKKQANVLSTRTV